MIQWLTYNSKAIAGYPMGDPSEREFPVYLPPHYNPQRKEPYPLVFILAGWGGKSAGYIADDSAFGISLPKRLDQAIQAGRLHPAVIVFPDCTSRLGGSQYLNSPSLGNYSDYLCDELVNFIESKFHIHRSNHFRGLMGHSSGGFGALINGMKRPDRFEFICSSAGDSFFEVSLLPLVTPTLIELEKAGSLVRFLDEYLNHPSPKNLPRTRGEALMLLSMAPCYAPNPKVGPLYGDLFFDLKTGAIIPEIWSRYLAWDPIQLAASHQAQLKKLKYIHLCSGLQDEYSLQYGHRQFSEKLKSLGISHEIEEYPGTHSGHTWRFEARLSKMLNAMLGSN